MKHLDYSVLILNYNSANYVSKAVDSIINNSNSDNYIIQIVDNSSSDDDRKLLRKIIHSKVSIVELEENKGFASGYNKAAQIVCQSYSPDYLVIMNPDIEILQSGSIEKMIKRINECDEEIVGCQPIVWDYRYYHTDDKAQLGIRRIPDYWDMIICESIVLRYFFRHRFQRYIMADVSINNNDQITFIVPSGAFFIIETNIFLGICGFDEGTFLYWEEIILGKKLEAINKKFVLDPDIVVKHYQGATTQFESRSSNRKMYRYRMESANYYAVHYLGVNFLKRFGLYLASEIGYLIRVIDNPIFRKFQYISTKNNNSATINQDSDIKISNK